MKKKQPTFDYIRFFKDSLRSSELYNKFRDYDSNFYYTLDYKRNLPPKIKNCRMLLQFEKGSQENSYINIRIGDYDSRSNEVILIGYFYIKDYFQMTKELFEFMYEMQLVVFDLQEKLYYDEV